MNNKKILNWLRNRRVAVLKGGWSRERPISLKTGVAVEAALRKMKIKFISIDVKPNILSVLKKRKVDFCFIALHGLFGEDGGIQSCLETLNIPYTGTSVLGSALAMDKALSKKIFFEKGIPTPPWTIIGEETYRASRKTILEKLGDLLLKGSLFIKPSDQGSAFGASRVDAPRDLLGALENCFKCSRIAVVERFIQGRELTVGIIGDRALPVIEIVPEHNFYDFHSKYAKGGSRHIIPARLSGAQTKRAKRIALRAFQALKCSVYGRVDLMLSDTGDFFVLEVNTIPGMTATSLLPEAAKASGLDFNSLVLEIIRQSLPITNEKKTVR